MSYEIDNISAPIEEDQPLKTNKEYSMQGETNKNDYKTKKDYENFKNGHALLMLCILVMIAFFFFDFFGNNKGHMAEIIEIFKVIIFTLMGFLFGKNSE